MLELAACLMQLDAFVCRGCIPCLECYPATVIKGKENAPWSICQVWEDGLVCKERSQGLFLPCHPESFNGVSLAVCEESKGCLGCCSTVCFCTVESLFLIKSEHWVNLAGD